MSSLRHALVPASLLAAFAPCLPAAEAAPARELLQPPKQTLPGPITDRLALRGMYYGSAIATTVRYDSAAGVPGTLLAAEDSLGLADNLDQGAVDLVFRMLERHRIRADYQQQTRNGDLVIDAPIQFGNDSFLSGERVVSHMDLRRFGLAYTYSLVRNDKLEVGLGLGINLLQLEGSLEAPARFVREQLDGAGPFPTLAMDATWQFMRRFSVNAAVQFLAGDLGEVEGSYSAVSADVQFRPLRNLAVGAGFARTRYRIDSTDPDTAGYFKLRYQGPQLFLRVSY
jgi:hypothetical protein